MRLSLSGLCMSGLVLVALSVPALAEPAPPEGPPAGRSPQESGTEDSGGGFVIGIGAGYGWTDWGVNHSGVFTSFKIGYAPSSRFAILWHSSGTFFKGTDDKLKMEGIGGGAVQIYLSRQHARSVYLIAGAGYHNVIRIDTVEGAGSNSIGFGIRAGAGFQFSRRWTVEGIVQRGFNAEERNPLSVGITLNLINR